MGGGAGLAGPVMHGEPVFPNCLLPGHGLNLRCGEQPCQLLPMSGPRGPVLLQTSHLEPLHMDAPSLTWTSLGHYSANRQPHQHSAIQLLEVPSPESVHLVHCGFPTVSDIRVSSLIHRPSLDGPVCQSWSQAPTW